MSLAIASIEEKHAMTALVEAKCQIAFDSGRPPQNPYRLGSDEYRIWSDKWRRLSSDAIKTIMSSDSRFETIIPRVEVV